MRDSSFATTLPALGELQKRNCQRENRDTAKSLTRSKALIDLEVQDVIYVDNCSFFTTLVETTAACGCLSNVKMKSILLSVLTVPTMAAAAVLSPALPLEVLSNPTFSSQASNSILTPSLLGLPSSDFALPNPDLPDERFQIKIAIGPSLLPVDSTLINILFFMSVVAAQDFTLQLAPRGYSSPQYRNVRITTFAWTEARFLLWGVYYAINDMIKFARFHDVLLWLYWEDKLVGKVGIAVKGSLDLAGGTANLEGDQLVQMNLTGNGEDATSPKPVVGNMTDSGLAPLNTSRVNTSIPSSYAVSFESIAGGGRLDRNEVFLTFYTALLHVAQVPAESQVQSFQSASPSGKTHLYMEALGTEYEVSKAIVEARFTRRRLNDKSG